MAIADAIFYFPLDWSFCVRRVLRAVRPSLVVVLETEIWPNFLREARRQNIPVLIVGGRISDPPADCKLYEETLADEVWK